MAGLPKASTKVVCLRTPISLQKAAHALHEITGLKMSECFRWIMYMEEDDTAIAKNLSMTEARHIQQVFYKHKVDTYILSVGENHGKRK